jgi:uncharacterized membrane protein YtjA (UPF0391 family)
MPETCPTVSSPRPFSSQSRNIALATGLLKDTAEVFHKMLWYAWVFLVIAILAAVFGFGGIASGAASIAKIFFFVFVVLFVISLIAGRRTVV